MKNICLTEAGIKPSKPIEFLHCNHEAKECFYEIIDENGDFVRIDKECDYETECGK